MPFTGEHMMTAAVTLETPDPDRYRRDLEPLDETIAELQSVVVAMRHRGDDDDAAAELIGDCELLVSQLRHVAGLPDPQVPDRRVQLIRLSMAIAATAIRYREDIQT